MGASTPANVQRTGADAVVDGNAVVWDEASNSLKDGGTIDEATILATEASLHHFQVTATAGQTVFPPASPLPALIFAEAALTVKQTVAIGGATKIVTPTAVNLSTGAVTIAAAAVDDVVHVTWVGVID